MKTPPFDLDETWNADASKMDDLIYSFLLQRLQERHWWENFAIFVHVKSFLDSDSITERPQARTIHWQTHYHLMKDSPK